MYVCMYICMLCVCIKESSLPLMAVLSLGQAVRNWALSLLSLGL